MLVATNQEKLSSSVFRSIVRALRADSQLKDILGDAIRPQPEWYLNGDPLVNGYVSWFSLSWNFSFLNIMPLDWAAAGEHRCELPSQGFKRYVSVLISSHPVSDLFVDSGTVYFTSIRKEKGVPFQVCESTSKKYISQCSCYPSPACYSAFPSDLR